MNILYMISFAKVAVLRLYSTIGHKIEFKMTKIIDSRPAAFILSGAVSHLEAKQ